MKKSFIFIAVFLLLCATVYPDEYDFIGRHYVASFKQCDPEALRDLDGLRETMIEASKASGATILTTSDFVFEPDGLTMVLLLSESHSSIHTYPEYNACFVDLFTCGTTCVAERFADVLKEYLKPAIIDEHTFSRD